MWLTLFTKSIVPATVRIVFSSAFQVFDARQWKDLSPCLVLLTFWKGIIKSLNLLKINRSFFMFCNLKEKMLHDCLLTSRLNLAIVWTNQPWSGLLFSLILSLSFFNFFSVTLLPVYQFYYWTIIKKKYMITDSFFASTEQGHEPIIVYTEVLLSHV